MKYIIMCGGIYPRWKIPRQLCRIGKEYLVSRTIRLLRENGVEDIAISSNNPRFVGLGVPVLYHYNDFIGYSETGGDWVDAFYPTYEPTCYLMGDVVFSENAIKTIVEKETTDIDFFASAPPFSPEYFKPWAEPFAFKVVNQRKFRKAIKYIKQHEYLFCRKPIAWELWQVIKQTPLNVIDYTNYTVINDYTCDIDSLEDVEKFKWLNT